MEPPAMSLEIGGLWITLDLEPDGQGRMNLEFETDSGASHLLTLTFPRGIDAVGFFVLLREASQAARDIRTAAEVG